MASLKTQSKQHSYEDRGHDLYETPPVAVEALLREYPIPYGTEIWEPACGPGSIVAVLENNGYTVYGSDIEHYGDQYQDEVFDFLKVDPELEAKDTGAIITNPPYKYATEFVSLSLQLRPTVIMLLRLAFLESQKRTPILDKGQLEWVFPFKKRLPMMHRHGWTGKKASSAIPFAWFVWNRGYSGPWKGQRIDW